MPRAIDPNATFDLWVESDADKAADVRPTFKAKYLSGSEWEQVAAVADAPAESTVAAALRPLYETLALCIVGWRNMDRAFSAADLRAVLDPFEARELLGKVLEAGALGSADRKKYDSRLQSDTDRCASSAAAGSVPTGQAT